MARLRCLSYGLYMNPDNDVAPMPICLYPQYSDSASSLEDLVFHGSSGLSQGLRQDLERWAQSYNDSFDENWAWKSVDHARQFNQSGNALAQRLADELGSEHEVEFSPQDEGGSSHKFSAAGPATNPRAAAVFSALKQTIRDEEVQRMRQIEAAVGEDFVGSVGWFSHGPLSDITIEIQQSEEQ